MLAANLVYSVGHQRTQRLVLAKRTVFAVQIEGKKGSRRVEEQIQVRERRERLHRMLNELVAINTRDKAFLCIPEPEPAEIADWRTRRSRVARILEEFQTLVDRASWEA